MSTINVVMSRENEAEVEVEYTLEVDVQGKRRPATWGCSGGSPAERPEWEILSILDEDGKEFTVEAFLAATGMSQSDLEYRMAEEMDAVEEDEKLNAAEAAADAARERGEREPEYLD